MAATHSTMRNGRGGHVSSTANDYAETVVETWQVRITTTLWKDGRYMVLITDRETGTFIHEICDRYPQSDSQQHEKQIDKRYRVHNPEEGEDTEEEKRAWDEREAETAANYYEQGTVLYE